MRMRRTGAALLALALAVVLATAPGCGRKRHGDVVIGRPSSTTTTAAPEVTIATEPAPSTTTSSAAAAATGARRPGQPRLLIGPDGRPYGEPLVFTSSVPVPSELLFVLVVGSDARPGEDLRRSHADSVHLLAVDPRTMRGTVVGFPRDSWVQIPGHGNGKLTTALGIGGPELLSATIRKLTGLPVDYWVLTGFPGLAGMVDELGGVDVLVERRMNDRNSGTNFLPGWHHFTGAQALAYSRDRHSEPDGDFSRSRHQGRLLLAGLSKLRAEVADDDGLRRWVDVLVRHAELDAPLSSLMPLAALARRLDPAALGNMVVTGRVGSGPGGQSVVYLGREAAAVFLDLRPDAVVGAAG